MFSNLIAELFNLRVRKRKEEEAGGGKDGSGLSEGAILIILLWSCVLNLRSLHQHKPSYRKA